MVKSTLARLKEFCLRGYKLQETRNALAQLVNKPRAVQGVAVAGNK